MRLRNVKDAKNIVGTSELVIKENIFNDNKPLHIEIGMGKGDFIIKMARNNPDINYIGIERYESVLCRALEKIEAIPDNLRFMCMDAKNLENIFDSVVDKIYLNFSDPWPKKRHAKRRLTSPIFLNIYNNICKDKVIIEMKTDNKDLFAYSLLTLNNERYLFEDVTLDLKEENSVTTEYEMKFRGQNITINKLVAVKVVNK